MEGIQEALMVVAVLVLLGGTLFWLRSKGIAQFGVRGGTGGGKKRMQSVERLVLTPQHSLHLVRVGNRVLLLAVWTGGCSVLEGNGWEISAEEGMVSR
jgi:flagellar biogenesis protein FliO